MSIVIVDIYKSQAFPLRNLPPIPPVANPLVSIVLVVPFYELASLCQSFTSPRRTEMEVVFLSIAEYQEETDDVSDGYAIAEVSAAVRSLIFAHRWDSSRAAEGFFPKYFLWYQVRRPFACGSGAGPLGSFS